LNTIKKIFLLTEAGGNLGFGHLIRSYSFCEKLQILENTFPVIKFHGHKEQIVALDLFSNQITFIKNEKDLEPIYDSILIVDAYTIDIDYLNSLNKFNNRLIFIADVHEKVPDCEVLINHLPWVNKNLYSGAKVKQFLLGPDYAILRKIFMKEPTKSKGRFLIYLGSSIVKEEIIKIYKALKSINVPDSLIDIVYNNQIKEIPFTVLKDLNSEQMFKLICNSEYTFITPGNISYEVFSVKRNCIMGSVSESQKSPLLEFQKLNLCVSVGEWSKIDSLKIDKCMEKSKQTVNHQKKYFINLKKKLFQKELNKSLQKWI